MENNTLQKKENKKIRKVVISGYYGFGNIGDEAILQAIIGSIRALRPETLFVVLSANPAFTASDLEVFAINRLNLAQIIKELISADLFISGGGGLMQDVTGPGSVIYYGGLLKLAGLLGIPTMVYAQGIGPLSGKINKLLVKKIFNRTSAITVREEFARQDLIKIGVAENKILVTADPVLLLKKAKPEIVEKILLASGINPNKPVIGIAIRPWSEWYERQLKAFSSILYQFARRYDFQLLLIPFQHSKDLWLCQETFTTLTSRPKDQVNVRVLEKEVDPAIMMGIIGKMHLIVGMRLHSLIMAATNLIPAVGIAYDPKVAHFCSLVGYPCIPSVNDLQEVQNNVPLIEDLIINYASYQKTLKDSVPKLQKMAENNNLTALELLKG